MASFPLSLRLLAAPLWWLALARAWVVEWRGPVVTLRVDARQPLPPPHVIAALAEAPEVRGLRLVLAAPGAGGWASLQATRRAIRKLRAVGKLVTVELEHAGNAELYLASVADRVWLRPERPTWLTGLSVTMRFFGAALARFGLRVEIEAAGEFKSFGEQFSRSYASEPNRVATGVLLADLEDELEIGIAEGRGVERSVVREAILAGPLQPEELVERGLADGVLYGDAAKDAIEALVGGELREVPFARWYKAYRARRWLEGWIAQDPVIAVVELDGPVIDGAGAPGAPVIAELGAIQVLRALAEDDAVRGVVLQIRSPGGSAAASDAIWRAVVKLNGVKPVVAVLGDVAASGGYYIAVGATEIIAESSTLTGSIGVIASKPVLRDALERHGVHTETLRAAPNADFLTDAAFTDEQRRRFRIVIDRMYRGFVERVAAGRKQAYDAVEQHARGRVWTGGRALQLGLIDEIGGLELGIERVASRASLRRPRAVHLRIQPAGGWLTRRLRGLLGAVVPELRHLPTLSPAATLLLESPDSPLMLDPTDWTIE